MVIPDSTNQPVAVTNVATTKTEIGMLTRRKSSLGDVTRASLAVTSATLTTSAIEQKTISSAVALMPSATPVKPPASANQRMLPSVA